MYQLGQLLENIETIFSILSIIISIISLIIILFLVAKIKKYKSSEKKLVVMSNRLNSIEKDISEKISKKELNKIENNLASLEGRVKSLEEKIMKGGEVRPPSRPIVSRHPLIRGVTVIPMSFQRYISMNPLISSGIIFDSSGMIIETAGIDPDKSEQIASYMYEVIRNFREGLANPDTILFQGDKGYGILLKLSEIGGTEIFAYLISSTQPSFTQCFVIRDALKKYVEKTFKGVKGGK